MRSSKFSCLLLVVPLLLAGCWGSTGPDGPPPPETSQVSGVILIDGEGPPMMTAIELKLYPKGRMPEKGEHIARCFADPEGAYVFSSYRDGDGAEPGEYVLSIEALRRGFGDIFGPDKFGNNFNSPLNEDPRFQVKVVAGESTEVPPIEIDTSKLETRPLHPYASPPGKRR